MDKDVIQTTLKSGHDVTIVPLKYFAYQAIVASAFDAIPDPLESDYRLPLPVETAVPGEMIPGTKNPAYDDALRTAATKRNQYIEKQCVLATVRVEDRQSIIDHYADDIAQLRTALELPVDPWAATLLYAVITDASEVGLIYKIARGEAPLTDPEVSEGIRLFRPALQRPTA